LELYAKQQNNPKVHIAAWFAQSLLMSKILESVKHIAKDLTEMLQERLIILTVGRQRGIRNGEVE
jgi:hypothetical protein